MVDTSILDRIFEFLKSDDLEMVQLGATLLKHQVEKERWEDILKESFNRDTAKVSDSTNYTYSFVFPKWDWQIEEDEIMIKEYDPFASTATYTTFGTVATYTYTPTYTYNSTTYPLITYSTGTSGISASNLTISSPITLSYGTTASGTTYSLPP